MNRSDRNLIITVVVTIAIIAGAYATLVSYTGFTSPFSVVMSQSMQHNDTESELGIIDTGDVVIVQDPDKAEIQSYVVGTQTGYSTFGDYGSVIIYERGGNQNPVIHRAIVWLEYDATTDTWSAPELENYEGEWHCSILNSEGEPVEHTDWRNLTGTFVMENATSSNKTVSIDLNTLPKTSGYLTMGDNVNNNYFDQSQNIVGHLIAYENIRSVPIFEIPWVGTLKILINNGGDNLEHVTNSLPSLIMCIVTVFSLLILVDGVSLYRMQTGIRYRLERRRECSRRG